MIGLITPVRVAPMKHAVTYLLVASACKPSFLSYPCAIGRHIVRHGQWGCIGQVQASVGEGAAIQGALRGDEAWWLSQRATWHLRNTDTQAHNSSILALLFYFHVHTKGNLLGVRYQACPSSDSGQCLTVIESCLFLSLTCTRIW